MTTYPTMNHVAAAAGVSPATVSRVLTGSARVAASTRRQVHAAIVRLGYVPRGSRPGDSRHPPIITAVIGEPMVRVFHDPFFLRLIRGAQGQLSGHGVPLPLLSLSAGSLPTIEKHLLGGGTSGILLISAHGHHPLALTLAVSRFPLRCAGRPAAGLEVPYVDVDNHGGARRAVEFLLQTRKRIGTITGPVDLPASQDRLRGYLDAMSAAGLPPLIARGDFTPLSGRNAIRALLDQAPQLDAVFAASDPMALGAISALRLAGRKVPADVAVVGFDDLPAAAHSDPPLTTVHQPVEGLGARTAELLLEQVGTARARPENPVLPVELVIRGSA